MHQLYLESKMMENLLIILRLGLVQSPKTKNALVAQILQLHNSQDFGIGMWQCMKHGSTNTILNQIGS